MNIDNPALLIFVIISLLVILVFVALMRTARNSSATRHLEAENLGFHFQEQPDPGLIERITALYQPGSEHNLLLQQVFHKGQANASLYIFSLLDSRDKGARLALDGAMAVISPLLDLPRFGLIPKDKVDEFASQSNPQAITRLIPNQGVPIDVNDLPQFNRRYLVTGEDPEQVRKLLTHALQDRLNDLESIRIEAGGDTLTIANLGYAKMRLDQPRDLDTLYRQVLTIFNLLRRK